jgi:hypothetical protein
MDVTRMCDPWNIHGESHLSRGPHIERQQPQMHAGAMEGVAGMSDQVYALMMEPHPYCAAHCYHSHRRPHRHPHPHQVQLPTEGLPREQHEVLMDSLRWRSWWGQLVLRHELVTWQDQNGREEVVQVGKAQHAGLCFDEWSQATSTIQ